MIETDRIDTIYRIIALQPIGVCIVVLQDIGIKFITFF